MAEKLARFCKSRTGYDDVTELCIPLCGRDESDVARTDKVDLGIVGAVYLLKSGRYFKIGRSNAVGRRERELQIQLPEKAALVHSIKTDDPLGIGPGRG